MSEEVICSFLTPACFAATLSDYFLVASSLLSQELEFVACLRSRYSDIIRELRSD